MAVTPVSAATGRSYGLRICVSFGFCGIVCKMGEPADTEFPSTPLGSFAHCLNFADDVRHGMIDQKKADPLHKCAAAPS